MGGEYSSNPKELILTSVGLSAEKFTFDANAADRIAGAADSDDYYLPGDFTAEFFNLNFNSVSTFQYMFSQFKDTTQYSYNARFRGDTSPKKIEFLYSTNGTSATTVSINWTPTVSTDYDVTLERSGTTLRLYVDGASVGTATVTGTLHNSTGLFLIGASDHVSGSTLNAKFQAFRLTKGVARYNTSGSYTVPSLPLPTSA